MQVTLHTNYGDIELTMLADEAPNTVANFVQYAKDGFYDGTLFHRVIPGFMIQGGGFASGMEQKETHAPIANEANNGVANERGSVAMARTNDPHSASSQFFINLADNDFLNFRNESESGWGYCVFARVSDGMAVAEKIKDVDTGNFGFHQNVPKEEVIIRSVTIDE